MTTASLVLAALLGQACPTPSSRWDPPPCAAANVPGCLPGYQPRFSDRLGRIIYTCDRSYAGPVRESLAEPQATPAPPPPAVMGPAAAVAPPVAYGSYPVASPTPEGRGHVGLVLMPGVSAYPATTARLDRASSEGQVALELRGPEGGGRLRFSGAYASFGKLGEVSVKYDFFDGFFFRPFVGLGLGIASINPDPTVRAVGSASAGVDLYMSRDVFLTGEVNGRIFTEGTQGRAHGLAVSGQKQASLLVGMGFWVF